MVAGAKLAALDSPLSDALPASDAPVIGFPGHRRDNVFLPKQALVAALHQPPLLLNVPKSRMGYFASLARIPYDRAMLAAHP